MGGRGQRSMGGGLFVEDNDDASGADYSRTDNFDHSTREYDFDGIKNWRRGEKKRAVSAINEYLSRKTFEVGEMVEIPAETLHEGGSFGYTVIITGEELGDYRIIERIRIV